MCWTVFRPEFPSCAVRMYDWVGNCIFMEWCYATLTRAIVWSIAHVTYIFLICTHSPTEKKKTSDSSDSP